MTKQEKEKLLKNLHEAYRLAQESIDKQEQRYRDELQKNIAKCWDESMVDKALNTHRLNIQAIYRNRNSNATKMLLIEELLELNSGLKLPDMIFTFYAGGNKL